MAEIDLEFTWARDGSELNRQAQQSPAGTDRRLAAAAVRDRAACLAQEANTMSRPPHRINPASLGSVRLISGMQMISNSPANSASVYGT
jgi:hypothetical protein